MKVYVLCGQVEWEEFAVYSVHSSAASAKLAAEPIIARLGGRAPKWLGKPGELDQWSDEYSTGYLRLGVRKSGCDIQIVPTDFIQEQG